MIPSNACSSLKLYRLWLKVLMDRNSAGDTTSSSNIGEEYHTSGRMVNALFVYVLNCHGQPLMPCQPRKARLLLKSGKAKVVKMVPFTLQLLNRQLHKATPKKGGKRQRNTAPKYVRGFCLFDCVKYQGKVCFVFGRRSTGYFDLRTLDGTSVHASASSKKLTAVQKASALLVERRAAFPPIA